MIGRLEHREYRAADDIGAVVQRDPDHFSEPVRIGIFVVVENGDVVGRRDRAAGGHKGAVICIGLAAVRFDDAGQWQPKSRRDFSHGRGAGAAFRIVIDDDDADRSGVVQPFDMRQ